MLKIFFCLIFFFHSAMKCRIFMSTKKSLVLLIFRMRYFLLPIYLMLHEILLSIMLKTWTLHFNCVNPEIIGPFFFLFCNFLFVSYLQSVHLLLPTSLLCINLCNFASFLEKYFNNSYSFNEKWISKRSLFRIIKRQKKSFNNEQY